jgi:uncharacterized membrane protein (DUF2068 family)
MTQSGGMQPRATASGANQGEHDGRVLLFIAIFKYVKGLLLLALAAGALGLLHKDAARVLTEWISGARVDPDNHFIHSMIAKVSHLTDRQLAGMSAGTFIYAGLFLTEGTGLILRKRWGEYLTIVTTALLVPLEIYELILEVSVTKIIVTLINIGVVWYLIVRVRGERKREHAGR